MVGWGVAKHVYRICDPTAPLSQERAARKGSKDVVFKFSHTTGGGSKNRTATGVFAPVVSHEEEGKKGTATGMVLSYLASRFTSRLMVEKPRHVVCWYGCVNDVFLPGLRVDLLEGRVEVEWRALVGGMLGEERGVERVRRRMVGRAKGRRGLWEMGGERTRGAGEMVSLLFR